MTPGLTIQLADVEFTGRRFRWEPGVYVVTFDGTDSGGNTAFQTLASGIGIIDASNRRETPRIFTISGFIYERSEWALQQRIDQLSALLAGDDDTDTLSWHLRGQRRWAHVRRHNWAPPRHRAGDIAIADFTLQLRASDQRIFGPTQPSGWGSSLTLSHRGGFPAPVILEVRGNSAGGYTATGPGGKIVRVTRPITPDAPHTYDADTGVLRVAGVAQTEGITRSDQIEMPVGRHQFSVDSGCEMRVTFAPTWAP